MYWSASPRSTALSRKNASAHLIPKITFSTLSRPPTKALIWNNEEPVSASIWTSRLKCLTRRNWRILEKEKKALQPGQQCTHSYLWTIKKISSYLSKVVTLKCLPDWRGTCLDSMLASLPNTTEKKLRQSLAWCRFNQTKVGIAASALTVPDVTQSGWRHWTEKQDFE